jgi:nitrogen-specific signal transduction histidine kinase
MLLSSNCLQKPARELTFEEIEHEPKMPLASMRSLAEIVRDHPDLPDEQQRQFVEAIVVESHRLSHSIEHMLDSRDMRDGLN